MPNVGIKYSNFKLTSGFMPQRGPNGTWVPPAGGATTATTRLKFEFTLPSDAVVKAARVTWAHSPQVEYETMTGTRTFTAKPGHNVVYFSWSFKMKAKAQYDSGARVQQSVTIR